MQYSIVISLHDEAENIPALLREVEEVLGGDPGLLEIILVDDGSRDGSASVLRAQLHSYPRLRCFRHDRRQGKSRGVLTGALAARAPWLLLMDGDGQNDPRDAAKLFARASGSAADERLAMAAGLRERRADSLWKRFGSRLGNAVRRLVLRDGCPDTGCGLKLVRRDAFLALPFFDGQHRFMSALLQAQGWRVAYSTVKDRPRLHGRSKSKNLNRGLRGLADLFGVFWLTRRARKPRVEELEP